MGKQKTGTDCRHELLCPTDAANWPIGDDICWPESWEKEKRVLAFNIADADQAA